MITLNQLRTTLADHPDAGLQLLLPTGEVVPPHFHITEVGYVTKDFIDCGGTRRTTTSCALQSLVAHDVDHRLKAGKLAGILELSRKVISDPEVPVELEYDTGTTSIYGLGSAIPSRDGKMIVISLEAKNTGCLAPDKCGLEELDEKATQATACDETDAPSAGPPATSSTAASGC